MDKEFEETKRLIVKEIEDAERVEELMITAAGIIMCYWPKNLKKAQDFIAKFYELNEEERARMEDCD